MKINNNLIKPMGAENLQINQKKMSAQKQENVNGHNFDQIIIDKSQIKSGDSSEFFKNIAAKVSAEVKTGAENQKLQKLQADVASGEYQINSTEIARKLMIGLA